MRETPKGLFGQELKVGDKIAMVAKSYGNSYMLVANIHSIDYVMDRQYNYQTRSYDEVEIPRVKVTYPKEKRKYVWDRVAQNGHYEPPVTVQQISRVYNWHTAITLP